MKQQIFNDGLAFIAKEDFIQDINGVSVKKVNQTDTYYFYEELTMSDKTRFIAAQYNNQIDKKIRIRQDKTICKDTIFIINGINYIMFNAYHFKNADGMLLSDISLKLYA